MKSRRSAANSPAAHEGGTEEAVPILRIAIVALAGLAVVTIAASVFFLPHMFVDGKGNLSSKLTLAERLKAENDIRSTLLQGLGGAFFLVTAFFTGRQLRVSQRQLYIATRQTESAEQRQLSERFGEALEHLSAEDAPRRVGAVYILDDLAKSSERYMNRVAEVLTAFVRQETGQYEGENPTAPTRKQVLLLDAALTVLARLATYHGGYGRIEAQRITSRSSVTIIGTYIAGFLHDVVADIIDLTSATMVGCNLASIVTDTFNLNGGEFVGSEISKVATRLADLRFANLVRAELQEVVAELALFQYGSLFSCKMSDISVEIIEFWRSNLSRATLQGVTSDSVGFQHAVMVGTGLTSITAGDIDMTGADASRAELRQIQAMTLILRDATLRGGRLETVEIDYIDMIRADLRETVFIGLKVRRVNASGANFDGCQFDDVEIEQLIVSDDTQLPTVLIPEGVIVSAGDEGTTLSPFKVPAKRTRK